MAGLHENQPEASVTSTSGGDVRADRAAAACAGRWQVACELCAGQGILPGVLDGGEPRSASRFLFQTMTVKVL